MGSMPQDPTPAPQHKPWCTSYDSAHADHPEEGCEYPMEAFQRGALYVLAGVVHGRFGIACEVRNTELVTEMTPGDLADLIDYLALGLALVSPITPPIPSRCPACLARVVHLPMCPAGGAR